MKGLHLSLATLSLLAANATAQSLEEAIKGVDVSGYLKYEYEDNRFKNQGFLKDNNGAGEVNHTWHAEAELKTHVQNHIALILGVYYDNSNNVNHGKGSPANESKGSFLGEGLGAGKDGDFGVSTFFATITPDFTKSNITLGKMRLATPLNDEGDDRGTGILMLNNDIPNISLVAGAFDAWSLDDLSDALPNQSITKPLYTVATLANYSFDLGSLDAQAWYFHIDDILDSAFFTEISFSHEIFHLSGQYAYAQTKNAGIDSLRVTLGENTQKYQTKSDFISLEAGVDFASFNLPLALNLGFITNTKDNFGVSLDDEGALQKVGALWFDNYDATEINFSAISGAIHKDLQKELKTLYASLSYSPLEDFSLGIDYVKGKNKINNLATKTNYEIDFYEVTPNLTWQYNQNIEFHSYYAILKTKSTAQIDSEQRNQFKLEAIYSF
ncbi:major outer membrane protein [Helicobacter winghamensis]|uniref:major outer membrane protein n=1 Tax=Helicobacter winghamensis TaxID=157268 RepID=UPI002797DE6F